MKRFIPLALMLAMTISLSALCDSVNASPDKPFVGIWHADNKVGDDSYAKRYALNDDGTFIFAAASDVIPGDRLVFADGKWSIENGELRLEFKTMYIIPMDPEQLTSSKEFTLLSNGLYRKICNPPEIETFSISSTDTDPDTGKKTVAIDDVTFYDFNGQTSLLDDYHALPKE